MTRPIISTDTLYSEDVNGPMRETVTTVGGSQPITPLPKLEPAPDIASERSSEISWLRDHPDEAAELAGQWVALNGEELVSSGTDITKVMSDAVEAGCEHPFVAKVPDNWSAYIF